MPVDSDSEQALLHGIELVRYPFDVDQLTSSYVRTTMFAWCGFARQCRSLAVEMQDHAARCMASSRSHLYESTVTIESYESRSRQYATMAYEAISRVNVASRLADRLDEIERVEEGNRVVV